MLVITALTGVIACGADDDDGSGDDPATDLPLFSECGSVEECAVGEAEGGACEVTPSTPDVAICTVACNTIEYDVPDPEVGGCYQPSPADTCAGGCCLLESVEEINDFGDEEGSGICVPEAP
jgi:hypothetical protein